MILGVCFEVLGEVIDAFAENERSSSEQSLDLNLSKRRKDFDSISSDDVNIDSGDVFIFCQ